jgi:diguanylate cyclase (GGDEF)-like protein/PAS domain S-box-containing protein
VLSGRSAEALAAERMAALAGVSARLAAVAADELEQAVTDGLDDLLLHLDADRWTLVVADGRTLGGTVTPVVLAGAEGALGSSNPILTADESTPELGPVLVEAGVASLAAVTATAGARPAGVLIVERDASVAWDPLALGLLRAIGDLLGAALARQRAEQAARRADDRYRRLLETSAEGVCLLDGDGTIQYANRSFGSLVGMTSSSLVGVPVLRFLPTPDATAVAARLLHETGRFELELRRADGQRRWVSCATSAVREDAADASQALVMMTDISVRRAAEAALRTSEARFRALVRSSSDVIVVTDGEGAVAYASPAVAEVLGHEPTALVGRSPLDLVHPDDLATVTSQVQELWEARAGSLVLRCRIAAADGRYVPMEAVVTNLIDDRAVAGITITARDITEQLELQASLAHEATHDAVTGLPNRRVFDRELAAAIGRAGTRLAVLFADLDGFKAVNDELGHDIGDQLLRAVGGRLGVAVREGDLVVRHGGDEFAVLCNGLADEAEAAQVAGRLVGALAEPIAVGDAAVRVGVSVGVAVSPPHGPVSARRLVSEADAAMYAAKASGAGWWSASGGDTVDRHRHPVAPAALGLVEGGVGSPDEGVDVATVAGVHGHTGADRDAGLVAEVGDGGPDALGGPLGVDQVAAGEDDDELLASVAGGGVEGPAAVAEDVGDLP